MFVVIEAPTVLACGPLGPASLVTVSALALGKQSRDDTRNIRNASVARETFDSKQSFENREPYACAYIYTHTERPIPRNVSIHMYIYMVYICTIETVPRSRTNIPALHLTTHTLLQCDQLNGTQNLHLSLVTSATMRTHPSFHELRLKAILSICGYFFLELVGLLSLALQRAHSRSYLLDTLGPKAGILSVLGALAYSWT